MRLIENGITLGHLESWLASMQTYVFFLLLRSDTISAYRSQSWCQRQPSFSFRQRKLCDKVPGLHTAIKKGLEMGQTECERLFKKSRWNCTLLGERSFLHRAPGLTSGMHVLCILHFKHVLIAVSREVNHKALQIRLLCLSIS